jgi:NAD(P)-dependent dehydrogenase (short-subunit alcohol dehydrogenase family)
MGGVNGTPATFETAVLTGATSGIGRETALLLAPLCRTLILHGPEPESAVGDLLAEVGAAGDETLVVRYFSADFRRLDAVRELAGAIRGVAGTIDLLVDNAGIPGGARRTTTADGIETTFQVNYVAMVLLTRLLLPALAEGSRIVTVSSATHEMAALDLADLSMARSGYSAVAAYARSKLAILSWSLRLAEELRDRDITVVSLSPGVISTGLLHAMFGAGGAPTARGAANVLDAATSDVPSGTYLDDGAVTTPSAAARDAARGRRLIALTDALIAAG